MITLISDLPLMIFVLVLSLLWLMTCSSFFLSWSEGLNFKSSNSLILCYVEWIPELISKACRKNRLVLLNIQILVLFSLKQEFVWCKFFFKGMLDRLPWDLETKVRRVFWTILSDFVAKSALQKDFKNLIKFKASLPASILFRWSTRFRRHDTSMLLLSILLTSNFDNNLFKLFIVSVAFPLSVLWTGLRNYYSTLGIFDFDIQY